jgi:hypothetical protein
MKQRWGLFLLAAAGSLSAAPRREDFQAELADIRLLAVERARRVPSDAQRVLKTAEGRFREARERYKVAGGTPPATLDGDIRSLSEGLTRIRLARSRGQAVPPDPAAAPRIETLWVLHQQAFDDFVEDARAKREGGAAEGPLYWETVRLHEDFSSRAERELLHNSPEDGPPLDRLFSRERARLLRAIEPPERVRGRPACVTSPEERSRPGPHDPGPFYRALGMIPQHSPAGTGAFQIPAGCRTPWMRVANLRRVFRAVVGRGSVTVGSQDQPLSYSYVTVPPDAPFLVQNDGSDPLEVEYMDLLP